MNKQIVQLSNEVIQTKTSITAAVVEAKSSISDAVKTLTNTFNESCTKYQEFLNPD